MIRERQRGDPDLSAY